MREYVLELNGQGIYVVDVRDDRVLSVERTSQISKAKKFTDKDEAESWKRWIESGSGNGMPGSGWDVEIVPLGLTYSI